MKQPKKLTRAQKVCLSAHFLNPDNWMLIEESEFYLKVIHKHTGTKKNLDKFRK